MEPWEPEEIFDKADFPVKKSDPKSGDKPKRPPPGPGSGPIKPAGVPGPPPAIRPAPSHGSGAAWEPDLDFERADYSGIPPEEAVARGDSRSSSDAMANVAAGRPGAPDGVGTPQAHSWQPPKLSEQARQKTQQAKQPESGGAQDPKVVGSRIRQGPGAERSGSGSADPTVSGFSRRLLEELAILHRENARHILRHWYWEKTGMAPEGLGHIQPHDRIYIVLSSLGSQVLIVVYESMSPTERRQMQEILDHPRNVTAADASQVRTVFMNLLRAEV